MIQYEHVLKEMEQLLTEARMTQDSTQIQAKLTAIRALCNVGLASETKVVPVASFPIKTPSVKMPAPVNKLHEADANGDSLFDF